MTASQSAPPKTMHAITSPTWGAPEQALVPAEVPTPEPGATEVLVEVHAAGVNPVDWKSRESGGFGGWGDPPIIGWDVSGVVVATGPGATLHAVGDEVFGMPHFPKQAGAYAQYVAAPSRQFVPKPAALSHVEAAALPLAGLTAWQNLVEVAKVQPGQRVLIHAAGGGVGHLAVQIAKSLGAHVIGTASTARHDWLRSLGADELIDYHDVDFTQALADEPVDVVIDGIGGDNAKRSLEVITGGGHLIVLPSGGILDDLADEAKARNVTTSWSAVEPDRVGLAALVDLVAAGKLKVEVAETFPLDEVAKAHALGEDGHTAGKIVLTVR